MPMFVYSKILMSLDARAAQETTFDQREQNYLKRISEGYLQKSRDSFEKKQYYQKPEVKPGGRVMILNDENVESWTQGKD